MVDWRSIDELTILAARSLELGEMVAEPSFDLFGSMSAIELMDPKMDPPQEDSECDILGAVRTKLASLGEAFPLQLAANIVGGLMRREVAWCDGVALTESVFTCGLAHAPVLQSLVQSYCPTILSDQELQLASPLGLEHMGGVCVALDILMTLQGCSAMKELILRADIYEVRCEL
jgi:hypothetical protein